MGAELGLDSNRAAALSETIAGFSPAVRAQPQPHAGLGSAWFLPSSPAVLRSPLHRGRRGAATRLGCARPRGHRPPADHSHGLGLRGRCRGREAHTRHSGEGPDARRGDSGRPPRITAAAWGLGERGADAAAGMWSPPRQPGVGEHAASHAHADALFWSPARCGRCPGPLHTHVCTCMQRRHRMHTRACTRLHTNHMHACTCKHMCTCVCTHLHSRMYGRVCARLRSYVHEHMCVLTCTRHTHTHAHGHRKAP